MTIEWRDPPLAEKHRKRVWVERLAPLTERPGVWAMVMTFPKAQTAHQTASDLRKGLREIPPGKWLFETANGKEGWELFVMYVGAE